MGDIGWAAGIIDGEGSIVITHDRPRRQGQTGAYHVRAQVTNTDPRIVWALKTQFGGNIQSRKTRTNSFSKHPQYDWSISGHACQKMLEAIRPRLKSKTEQADTALALLATIGRRRGRVSLDEGTCLRRTGLIQNLRWLKTKRLTLDQVVWLHEHRRPEVA